MSTNVFLFQYRLFLKAGAKVKNLFISGKKILKFFFENFFSTFPQFLTSLSMSFPCFAGCKCNIHFLISQAFLNLFQKINFPYLLIMLVSISVNVYRCCGCKSSPFIELNKLFMELFLIFFTSFS